jgi:hypothetical protein
MPTYCYPYKRGTGYRSQGFRSGKGSPYNPPDGHTGFDQAMDAGTPIYAPGDGIIRNSGWLSDNYLANDWWLTSMGGDILVIDCYGPDGTTATGPTFVIAHLQDSIPEVGQRVKKGQLIGLSGNSGTATTGAHAHIEALPPMWAWNNGVYGRVDPEHYFTEWPEDIIGAIDPQGTIQKEIQDIMTTANEAALALLKMRIARMDAAGKQDGVTSVEQVIANFNQTMVRIFDRLDAIDARHTAFQSTTHQKQNAHLKLIEQLAAKQGLTAEEVKQALSEALNESVDSITTEQTKTTFDLKLPGDNTTEVK